MSPALVATPSAARDCVYGFAFQLTQRSPAEDRCGVASTCVGESETPSRQSPYTGLCNTWGPIGMCYVYVGYMACDVTYPFAQFNL